MLWFFLSFLQEIMGGSRDARLPCSNYVSGISSQSEFVPSDESPYRCWWRFSYCYFTATFLCSRYMLPKFIVICHCSKKYYSTEKLWLIYIAFTDLSKTGILWRHILIRCNLVWTMKLLKAQIRRILNSIVTLSAFLEHLHCIRASHHWWWAVTLMRTNHVASFYLKFHRNPSVFLLMNPYTGPWRFNHHYFTELYPL